MRFALTPRSSDQDPLFGRPVQGASTYARLGADFGNGFARVRPVQVQSHVQSVLIHLGTADRLSLSFCPARPSAALSRIICLWNSATLAKMWKTKRSAGVVSIASFLL